MEDKTIILEQPIMQENMTPEQFAPAAKVLAATAMAESLNYILRRSYLEQISVSSMSNIEKEKLPFNYYLKNGNTILEPVWLKIEQVGLPIDSTFQVCFDALQRILHSCNQQSQVLFLVICENKKFNMYLGVRLHKFNDYNFIESLKNFSKGCWAGLNMKAFGQRDDEKPIYVPIASFKKDNGMNSDVRYESVISLTGIPTLDLDEKKQYPMSIDHFLAGIRDKNIAYLIVADPIPEQEIDKSLFELRDMGGQIESLKTLNLQLSKSYSQARSECKSWSETKSNKDFKRVGEAVLNFVDKQLHFKPARVVNDTIKKITGIGFTGIGVAGAAAAAAKMGAATAAAAGGTAALPIALTALGAAGLASSFIPQKSDTLGGSDTETFTDGQSQSISQTLINKHAENTANQITKYAQRYELGRAIGMWNVGVYLFGENEHDTQNAALQLRAINSGAESIYEPIRIHNITNTLSDNNPFKTLGTPSIYTAVGDYIFENPLGKINSEVKTILTTQELTSYINFPLRSVPGISVVDSSPDFSLNEQNIKGNSSVLDIGKLLYGGTETSIDCCMPLDTLSRHALVAGVNGSGKTNTVLSILSEFQKHGKPFLIIEPAKTEYVDWAIEYNKNNPDKEQIRIFMPGDSNTYKGYEFKDKLRFNPFEIIQMKGIEPRVLSHIDRVKSIFAAAFPMQDILPVIMENLIYSIYDIDRPSLTKERDSQIYQYNWFEKEMPNYRKTFPQLSSMLERIKSVIVALEYDDRNMKTLTGCLRTRIMSLTKGWKKDMLDNERLGSEGWDDLFSKPCIINLSAAGDDVDKAFIMSLLVQFLYEYRIAESEKPNYSFNDNICRHLVVIEEAHRIMTNCSNPELPQYKSGLMFSNLLSEVRAYGQGIMIVDQVPTRLIPDAVKNTNIKIIHKLVAADDAKVVSESMGLSESQQKIISKLSTGQAIIAGLNSAEISAMNNSDIYWVKINKKK